MGAGALAIRAGRGWLGEGDDPAPPLARACGRPCARLWFPAPPPPPRLDIFAHLACLAPRCTRAPTGEPAIPVAPRSNTGNATVMTRARVHALRPGAARVVKRFYDASGKPHPDAARAALRPDDAYGKPRDYSGRIVRRH